MEDQIADFLAYISSEKGLSPNTIKAYSRDIKGFNSYIQNQGISNCSSVTTDHVINFIASMQQKGYASATLYRTLVAIKVFFRFLVREEILTKNITLYH